MNAAFFDTNIVAYAADTSTGDIVKRDRARQLLQLRSVVTSTQVLMELYSVLRKKLGYATDSAIEWVRMLEKDEVVTLSPSDVIEALRTGQRHQISHWDGLILVAASRAGSNIVYSEDLNHGQTYGNVRICNPFKEDFLA